MNKSLLFFQGAGTEGYEADKKMVASLQTALGKSCDILYPEIHSDEAAADFGWTHQIARKIAEAPNGVVLAGHSLGASLLLKYLSENTVNTKIEGVFLMATPFWEGNEDWKAGLKLKENFADTLPHRVPIFFYHCQDDKEVPFSHLNRYRQKLPQATFREIKSGGHQFNNDLTLVADDIQSLQNSLQPSFPTRLGRCLNYQ